MEAERRIGRAHELRLAFTEARDPLRGGRGARQVLREREIPLEVPGLGTQEPAVEARQLVVEMRRHGREALAGPGLHEGAADEQVEEPVRLAIAAPLIDQSAATSNAPDAARSAATPSSSAATEGEKMSVARLG